MANLLSDEQAAAAVDMANNRNLTAHTYNEALAQEIFMRIGDHAALLQAWLAAMEARVTP